MAVGVIKLLVTVAVRS